MFKRSLPFWIRINSVIFIIILTCIGLPEDEDVGKEESERKTIDSYIWEIIGRILLLLVAETALSVQILSRFSNSCVWIRKLMIGSLSFLFAMHGTNTAVNSVLVIATHVVFLLLLKILYTIVEVFVAVLYEEVTKKKNRTDPSEPAKSGGPSCAIQPPQYVVAPVAAATPPVAPESLSPPVKNMVGPANNMSWNSGREDSAMFQTTGSVASDTNSVRSDESEPFVVADRYKKKSLKKVSMK